MKRQILRNVLLFVCLIGALPAMAAFKDIKIDLTNGNLITSEEKSSGQKFEFGVVIGDDGTQTRVAADDASANIVLSGKYHSDQHGWGNFSCKVPVEGPVKISMGTCNWGGDVTVKNSAGTTVATFNTNTGEGCYSTAKPLTASAYYKGTEATTLTISGGSYTPYIAVEHADASELAEEFKVSFDISGCEAEGVAPAEEKVESGKTFTIPANRTLYISGKTLTGWTDGTSTYKAGDAVTITANTTLTPVFTANTKTLADRTEPATLLWDFQRQNGAPRMAYERNKGIYVTQVTIGGETIDVKMDMDATSGKVNNNNWTDWCQWNNGTKFTVPSCTGATVTIQAMSPFGADGKTATTVDGQTDYESANPLVYTIASQAETIDIVIGNDGGYYRSIQMLLPVVKSNKPGFNNAEATVNFPFNGEIDEPVSSPEGAFTTTSVSFGENLTSVKAQAFNGITYTRFQPSAKGGAENDENAVEFKVVPSKGITFTPTKVSANIMRFGTDGGQMAVRVRTVEGKTTTLATGIKPMRNKAGNTDVASFEYDVPTGFATEKGFSLLVNIYDNTGKQYGLNNVNILGTVSGEKQDVARYTITATANPEEAGTVSLYPAGEEFDEGTELKLTAKKNFGYEFVNWTDAANNELGTEQTLNITLNANTDIKANFKKLNTYSLDVTVNAPGKDYMVSATPAATVVEGKNMYEEGTKVTLTASSNKIVTFNSWSNGETASELQLDMTENKSLEANFSAIDFIAGWDFVQKGNNGRKADFAAEDNDADALVLRDADGKTIGWLDKSQSSGGYEGKWAAVNWNTEGLGKYYWQTMVNASAFTDVKVSSAMVFNYNAYTKYDVEYSLNGETWTQLGSFVLEGAKNWKTEEFALPAAANNQPAVYIRWIADKTSEIKGATSNNDGIGISDIYITGTAKIVDDGKAPVLVETVPADNAENVSANGNIILTFDEKVKVAGENTAATLDGKNLTPAVSGKTVSFEYKALEYDTQYTFTLPANSISDLTDNKLAEPISITFKTKARPVVTKAMYDFIVPADGTLIEAFAAAAKRADKTQRYRIFIKKGNYVLEGNNTSNQKVCKVDDKEYAKFADPTTYLNTPNVSIIGEDMTETIITNKLPDQYKPDGGNIAEGIGQGDVLCLQSGATNTYMQNFTIKSAMGDAKGRDIELNDQSNKTVCKDMCLWGFQDTYVSNSDRSRFYFEGGLLRGNTDYLCGKGDVFYNKVNLQMCGTGYLAVPSKPTKYGYIFKDCTIKAEKSGIDGNYTLGRPWGSGTPIALFIDTKMEAQPSAIGWNEMSGGWPARFAEYNSMTSKGTVIDLSGRKKTFGDGHANNPVLTKEEAAQYTLATVMGSTDNWDPTALTEQASAPQNVLISEGKMTWDDSQYVLLWAVCKDGKVVDFTTENHYDNADTTGKWSVRAANEMGGLSEAAEAGTASAVKEVNQTMGVTATAYYTLDGTRVNANYTGTVIKVMTMTDGTVKAVKVNR